MKNLFLSKIALRATNIVSPLEGSLGALGKGVDLKEQITTSLADGSSTVHFKN